VLDAPGRAMLYLTLPGVFNGDREMETERVKRERIIERRRECSFLACGRMILLRAL